MGKLIQILVLIVVLISVSQSAFHHLFKTCNQSSFCRRNRGLEGEYEVDVTSMIAGPYEMSVDLLSWDAPNVLLRLTVRAIENNMFRFDIDEKLPTLRERYRVEDALDRSPNYEKIIVTTEFLSVTVHSSTSNVVIYTSPFRMDFYQNGEKVLVVNEKNLFRFEHLRTRPNPPEIGADPGEWEEEFNGYVDAKPWGPEGFALDFTFPQSEVFFGIPEHADDFILKETAGDEPYRLFTVDQTFYELNSRMPLYGAVPVLYAHGPEHTAGIFWHNSADTYVDIIDNKTTQFISEAGVIDVFVFLGPKPLDAFAQYTQITGVGTLPPAFSLGMHQSRWNYMNRSEVEEVVANYDKYDIPLDSIWLDILYTDGMRYFTWDLVNFPGPVQMMDELRDTGRHLTFIIDPHIKIDEGYFFFRDLRNRDAFIKDRNGSFFEGDCWPGPSHWIDFLNPVASQFYGRHYMMNVFRLNAVDTGVWNDMNEPAVFNDIEKTIYRDAVHYNGVEHRTVHNLYGYLQTRATYDGLLRRANSEERPFILTRSFFAGSQRYAAVWTGDNTAEWGHLKASIQMCLSISVSGISFCGADIGGFFGNPNEELQVRWTQAAVYQPFVRNHAEINTKHREPFLLSEPNRNITRDAIKVRYSLIKFWYTLFYEHTVTGYPVMRPMLAQYPHDTSLYKLEEQYMLSDKLLVAPVLTEGATNVSVHFPVEDIWYDFDDYSLIETNSTDAMIIAADRAKIPVFQRGGTIIPKQENERRASVYMQDDPISLMVALDKDGHAEGTLYTDDSTFAYLQGFFSYQKFVFHQNKLTYSYIDHTRQHQPMNPLGNIAIAGLDFQARSAVARHENGEERSLPVEVKDNYVVVDASQIFISNVLWTIEVNSGLKNFVCGGLLIAMLSIHVIRMISF